MMHSMERRQRVLEARMDVLASRGPLVAFQETDGKNLQKLKAVYNDLKQLRCKVSCKFYLSVVFFKTVKIVSVYCVVKFITAVRHDGELKCPCFCFLGVWSKLACGDTAGYAVWSQISTSFKLFFSRISQQNTHFNMYTETSTRQKDSPCKNSRKNILKRQILNIT